MEVDYSVGSMLKEIKINLSNYESIIKEIEEYPTKKKLTEAETTKKKIERKIKMVKTIVKTKEDNFMLDSYIDFSNDLNKRLDLVIKRQVKNKEKNNYKDLFNDKEKNLGNMENINTLDDENQSLKNCIKMSNDITNNLNNTFDELENQNKRLDESSENVVKTLQKMPIIGKMMGDIKYYQIREKLIIGCVVGVVIFIMLFITFHKRG